MQMRRALWWIHILVLTKKVSISHSDSFLLFEYEYVLNIMYCQQC